MIHPPWDAPPTPNLSVKCFKQDCFHKIETLLLRVGLLFSVGVQHLPVERFSIFRVVQNLLVAYVSPKAGLIGLAELAFLLFLSSSSSLAL